MAGGEVKYLLLCLASIVLGCCVSSAVSLHERTLFVSPDDGGQRVQNTVMFHSQNNEDEGGERAMNDFMELHRRMRRAAAGSSATTTTPSSSSSSSTTTTSTTTRVPPMMDEEKKIIPKVIITVVVLPFLLTFPRRHLCYASSYYRYQNMVRQSVSRVLGGEC